VAFVAAVQAPHTSLLVAFLPVALMAAAAAAAVVAVVVAAADLIIANCRSMTSHFLRHSIPSWRIE
jgi:hypothetical protein